MIWVLLGSLLGILFFVWVGLCKYTKIWFASLITILLIACATYWAIEVAKDDQVQESVYKHL